MLVFCKPSLMAALKVLMLQNPRQPGPLVLSQHSCTAHACKQRFQADAASRTSDTDGLLAE